MVPNFVGHGVGWHFHSAPVVTHVRNREPGVMVVGQTFTIEPMLTEGTTRSKARPPPRPLTSCADRRGVRPPPAHVMACRWQGPLLWPRAAASHAHAVAEWCMPGRTLFAGPLEQHPEDMQHRLQACLDVRWRAWLRDAAHTRAPGCVWTARSACSHAAPGQRDWLR